MSEVALSPADRAMMEGRRGEAARLGLSLIVRMAEAAGAASLLNVVSAHVDGCLYQGQVSLDFAHRLADAGARVSVPTTLNVGALDLLHPDLYRGDAGTAGRGRALMDLYVAMGCQPTWTCAPYQLPERPAFGQHVAWAESNAIVFANSVLGARTERYGDFIDICAAITGRAPAAGYHLDANRRGRVLFRLDGIPEALLDQDALYPVLGHLVGGEAGTSVPVIAGLPSRVSEDRLKALGAAAASNGSVALFHAVGSTPEAPTLEDALHGLPPDRIVEVALPALVRARDSLSTTGRRDLAAVSLGTPHLSLAGLRQLRTLLAGARVHDEVDLYVSTSRHVLEEGRARGWVGELEASGATLVTDTCTYIAPIIRRVGGPVMTDSAKWAFYAPGTLGVEVVFGSTKECVRSAVEGRVWRDRSLWAGAGPLA